MHLLTEKKDGTVQEYLFWISFVLYIAATTLQTTFFFPYFTGAPYKMIILFCLLCLVIREVMLDYFTTEALLPFTICAVLAAIIAKNAPQIMFVAIPMYVYAARNMSFRKIALVTAMIQAVILAVVVLASQAGLITDYFEMWSGRTRHYLGFRYSLYGPSVLYNIIALYLYAKGRSVRWYMYGILAGADVLLYYLTDSRMTFTTSMILILISVVDRIFPNLCRRIGVVNRLCVLAFPICCFGSIWVTASYRPFGFMKRLNASLANRIYYGYNSLLENGFRLFGQKITWVGNGLRVDGTPSSQVRNYVDNLYLQDLQRYGLVFLVLMIAVLTVFSWKCYKQQNYLLLYMLALTAGHAILDDLVFFLCYNTFWLAMIPTIHPALSEVRTDQPGHADRKMVGQRLANSAAAHCSHK